MKGSRLFMFFFGHCVGMIACAQNMPVSKKVEGLNTNMVYCVMQDSKEYIWVGTETGVSRYDGYGFKHFTKDDGLTDNDVFNIVEDAKGRLWFLTYNGIPTLYDNGRLLTGKNCSFLKGIKPGFMAIGLVQKQDSIFFVTLNNAYVFVGDSLVKTMHNTDLTRSNDYFRKAIVWNNNVLLTSSNGIVNATLNRYMPFSPTVNTQGVSARTALKGNHLYATLRRWLGIIDVASGRVVDSVPYYPSSQNIALINSPTDNNIWISMYDKLFVYDPVKRTSYYKQGVPTALTDVLRDAQGNIWMGSLENGLHFFASNMVSKYNNSMAAAGASTAYSLARYGASVLAGYSNFEYNACNRPIGSNMANRVKSQFTHDRVYGFDVGADDMWIIAGEGTRRIGAGNKTLSQIIKNIKALARDRHGNLYVASSTRAYKVDSITARNKVIDLPSDDNALFAGRVNSFLCAGSDTVWMGTITGLQCLVHSKAIMHKAQLLSIAHAPISKVINTKYGTAFSTQGEGVGIITVDSVYVLDKRNGLVNNSCFSIYNSGDTLWVATAAGISCVRIHQEKQHLQFFVTNFTEANGLLSNKVNDVLVYRDTVWAATEKGVCSFHVSEIARTYPPPRLWIEDVRANAESILGRNDNQLDYTRNNIKIRFTGLSYHSFGNIKYRYRLLGGDGVWQETQQREVEYLSLPPGKYMFEIFAANANGTWTNDAVRFGFEIVPPFWQTWWFRILCALLVVLAIAMFARYRIRLFKQGHLLEKKALVLEKERADYERQLVELEQQALRLQMNPHFVFNAIANIQGLYASHKSSEAKEYLVRFSRLLRSVFEVADEKCIPISKEVGMLDDYIQLTLLRFDYAISYSIEVDSNIVQDRDGIAPMLIQPFVENALQHGLLPLKGPGHLQVKMEKVGHSLMCTVEDNGLGNNAMLHSQQHNGPHGLSITKKRIALLNSNGLGQDFTIEDAVNKQGDKQGIKITFLIPLKQVGI